MFRYTFVLENMVKAQFCGHEPKQAPIENRDARASQAPVSKELLSVHGYVKYITCIRSGRS